MYGAKVRDFPKILCGAMLFFHIVDKPAAAAQENPAPFAAVMTDYGYETADGKAKSRVTTLQNRVTYGTAMTAENTVTNYNSAYEYDANGNITAEYAVQADNTRTLRYRYTYDEANQLTRVDDNVRGKTYVYTYDKGGNRVSEKIYNYTLSNSFGTAQQTIESKYGYLTWKDRLSSYNGNTITYDAAGNPIKYGNTTYAWSGKQLVEIQPGDGSKTQFSYDADGLRTQKRQYNTEGKLDYYVDYVWQNGKLTQQVMTLMGYNADGSTVKIRPINTKFVYDGNSDQPTACFVGEMQMLFVRNLQGDIIAVVNADGEVLVNFTYDAWGNVESTVSEGQEEGLATLIPLFCPLTYRGYNYDFTTGLYYLQSRYYNPEWGRFMNVDDTSILLATQGDTHNANLFAYCSNNPVNNVDRTGYFKAEFHYAITLDFAGLLFKKKYAKFIAKGCQSVDTRYSPLIITSKYYQSFHFNINIGTSLPDSRILRAEEKIADAIYNLNLAVLCNRKHEKIEREKYLKDAFTSFGEALHPVQDMIAHSGPQGQKYGYFYYDPVTQKSSYSFEKLYSPNLIQTGVFYHHLGNGNYNADDPDGLYLNTGKTKRYYCNLYTAVCFVAFYCYVRDCGLDDVLN